MNARAELSQLDRLRARVAELEAELAEWRRQYGDGAGSTEGDCAARLRVAYGLTPAQAIVLATLLASAGKPVRYGRLVAVLGCDARDVDPKIVRVYICRLRTRLGAQAIETVRASLWGEGGFVLSALAAESIAARLAEGERYGRWPGES